MENMGDNKQQWGIPDNYFKNSKLSIFQKIELEEEKEQYEKLYALRQDNFILPDNYFQENNANIQSEIKLNEWKQDNVFTVPENYFSENAKHLQQTLSFIKVTSNEPSIFSRLKKYRFHAAAAVFIMSLSFIGLNYFKNETTENKALIGMESGIDIEDIEENDIEEQIEFSSNIESDINIEQQIDEEDITNSI
jgi:hypothetical protein